MRFLSIAAFLDDGHDDIFGGHEGKLLGNASSDDFGINDETLRNILKGRDDDVGSEERFWESDATIGAEECSVGD